MAPTLTWSSRHPVYSDMCRGGRKVCYTDCLLVMSTINAHEWLVWKTVLCALFLRWPRLAVSVSKGNVTVWRSSVRLSRFSNLNTALSAYSTWLTTRQHATRPAYISVRVGGWTYFHSFYSATKDQKASYSHDKIHKMLAQYLGPMCIQCMHLYLHTHITQTYIHTHTNTYIYIYAYTHASQHRCWEQYSKFK